MYSPNFDRVREQKTPRRKGLLRRTLGWILGFLILVGFQFLGIGLHRLGVPLPGTILGLLLFTFALATELVKVEWVEQMATFLVRHMMLLFIPLMAGLPGMSAELRRDGIALLASTIVSLLAVLLITGGLAHFLLRDAAGAAPTGDAEK